jgi:glutathione S-transferase
MWLTLYGDAASTCTQRVPLTFARKGLICKLVTVNLFKGEYKQPLYTEQLFGKIPVLAGNGFYVYQSRAICKYLTIKNASEGDKLVPLAGDLRSYALFEQVSSSSIGEDCNVVVTQAAVRPSIFSRRDNPTTTTSIANRRWFYEIGWANIKR